MPRWLPWLGCFAAGIVLGFLAGREWDDPKPVIPGDVAVTDPRPALAPSVVPPAGLPAREDPAAARGLKPALPTAPAADLPARPPLPGEASVTPVGRPEPGAAPYLSSVDSGVVIPIDAGEVFNKQIARESTAGNPNQLGDAHRALEREPRDDSWAYTMEAELRNALISQTSMGAFTLEHVECRTTLCELRVSGRGGQAAAVRDWANTLHAQNFGSGLFMNLSSSVSDDNRIDAIYIFRRPRQP